MTRFAVDVLDVLLNLLRPALPGVNVMSRIPDHVPEYLPLVDPAIELNMLADDRDRVRLRDGAQRLFAIGRHPAVAGIAEAITLGGTGGLPESIATPAAHDAWLDATVFDTYHPCGTCRMGAADDPGVVVDPTCRVNGVDNLRVIDAAIMPTIPRANIHLACVMIGEQMATRLRA